MSAVPGSHLDSLDTPTLLIDLNLLDANLERMRSACQDRALRLRVHFKSLKCGNLAKYLLAKGITDFLCAKTNEAEILADAGIPDILIANEIIGPMKLRRIANLAKRVVLSVCVDDAENATALSEAAKAVGATIGILIEVDIGMRRCGVEPGDKVVDLARQIQSLPNLTFRGLQGYDGHLQMVADPVDRRRRCMYGMASLMMTRKRLLDAAIPVAVVTGGGTGTGEFVSEFPGMTELQPGSFLLMDAEYHKVRPEFACSLSILTMVISRRESWYVLDAGSKAISQDFGKPAIKDHLTETVAKLSEEHAVVESPRPPKIGDRRQVYPAHCCATMNLHRQCVVHRGGIVEAEWPIEASGRYD